MPGPDAVRDVPTDVEFEMTMWWTSARERFVGLILLAVAVALLFQVVVNHQLQDIVRILASIAGILLGLATFAYVVRFVIPPKWKQRA